MKRDYLKWGALLFALVATASAEYELARAVGFNQWVAAAVPGALDIYTVRAMRAHRDVLAAVAAMIGVNAASHLVTAGLLPVNVPLVVAVSAIAPLVLWRVHRLTDEPISVDVIHTDPAAEVTTERADAEQVPAPDTAPQPVPIEAVPRPELTAVPDTENHPVPVRQPRRVPAKRPTRKPVPTAASTASFEEHVRTAKEMLTADPGLSGTEIGKRLGTGDSYGRRVKRAALAPIGTAVPGPAHRPDTNDREGGYL